MKKKLSTALAIDNWKPVADEIRSTGTKTLYIKGAKSGSKTFAWRKDRKYYYFSGGHYPTITLAEAKMMVEYCNQQVKAGVDVELLGSGVRQAKTLEELKSRVAGVSVNSDITLDQLYLEWYNANKHTWQAGASRNRPWSFYEHHIQQHLGHKPIRDITQQQLFEVLNPLHIEYVELGTKITAYLSNVFGRAANKGLIAYNPVPDARSFDKTKKIRHSYGERAVEPDVLPDFCKAVMEQDNNLSLKLVALTMILTAHRSSAVRFALWEHILADGEWRITARADKETGGLMKSGREFSIWLPEFILGKAETVRVGEYLFTNPETGKPYSDVALNKLLQKIDPNTTAHAFRNTFSVWAETRQNPIIRDDVIEDYIDHQQSGLRKRYRIRERYQDRKEVAQRYWAFMELEAVCASTNIN